MEIGLIGAEAWGQNHLRESGKDSGVLAAVSEADSAWGNRLQEEHADVQVTPLLRDPSGDARRPGASSSLAGKDVFIEKPLALTAADGEELVQLARSQQRSSSTIPLCSS